ncbi:methyltransferase, partial [Streptomyces sp. DSM 44917]
ARVTALDVSRRAVLATRLTARRSHLRVRVLRGDMASLTDRSGDVVVSNPPYVPSPSTAVPTRGKARAWDAGRDGRAVLDGVERRLDLLVDESDGVVLGALRIPPAEPDAPQERSLDPAAHPWLRTCQTLVRTLAPSRPARAA